MGENNNKPPGSHLLIHSGTAQMPRIPAHRLCQVWGLSSVSARCWRERDPCPLGGGARFPPLWFSLYYFCLLGLFHPFCLTSESICVCKPGLGALSDHFVSATSLVLCLQARPGALLSHKAPSLSPLPSPAPCFSSRLLFPWHIPLPLPFSPFLPVSPSSFLLSSKTFQAGVNLSPFIQPLLENQLNSPKDFGFVSRSISSLQKVMSTVPLLPQWGRNGMELGGTRKSSYLKPPFPSPHWFDFGTVLWGTVQGNSASHGLLQNQRVPRRCHSDLWAHNLWQTVRQSGNTFISALQGIRCERGGRVEPGNPSWPGVTESWSAKARCDARGVAVLGGCLKTFIQDRIFLHPVHLCFHRYCFLRVWVAPWKSSLVPTVIVLNISLWKHLKIPPKIHALI